MRTTLAVMVGAVAALSACSADSGRFFVVQDQVPDPGCIVTTNRTVYEGSGRLDLDLVGDGSSVAYELYPLLQNDYPVSGQAGAPEPNRLFVRAFRVNVQADDGNQQPVYDFFGKIAGNQNTASLLQFQEPWAATIDPGGGLLAAAVPSILGDLGRKMRDAPTLMSLPFINVTVRLRAVGHRQDGDVESDEFAFPVQICRGCLVNVQTCPFTATNKGHACNIAQDAPIDCCDDGTQVRCPSSGPAQ